MAGFCPQCGAALADDARFCAKCGRSIGAPTPMSFSEKYAQAEAVPPSAPVPIPQAQSSSPYRVALGLILIAIVVAVALVNMGDHGTPPQGGQTEPTPTPPAAPPVAAWPDAYQAGVCAASTIIVGMVDHFSALERAANAIDFASVSSESASIAEEAKQAQDALVGVPSWAPGNDLVRQLNAVTANVRKAANEYQLGVSTLDPSLIEAGTTLMTRATGQMDQATVDLTSLHAEYGFSCP